MRPTKTKSLRLYQCDVLIEHCAGPVAFNVRGINVRDRRHLTVRWLVGLGLLSYNTHRRNPPTHTALTELGRKTVCGILGEYADALVAAGLAREALQPLDFWLVAAE